MGNQTVIQYILEFLLGDTQNSNKRTSQPSLNINVNDVGYTDVLEEMERYKIVIKPSSFFSLEVYGRAEAEPQLPLAQWRGIPLLFGTPKEEYINEGKTLLLHADIIASSYYLISRYEEMYHRAKRDKYGRFLGKESLPYRAGFIHRPIVDEYRVQLTLLLHQLTGEYKHSIKKLVTAQFLKVNLTHDINYPYAYRGVRNFLSSIIKQGLSPWSAFKLSFSSFKEDPYFTFPKFLEWNNKLKQSCRKGLVDSIFFLRLVNKPQIDGANYSPRGRYIRPLLHFAKKYQIILGLQASYSAGIKPEKLQQEVEDFRIGYHSFTHHSRHQLLSIREPEDYLTLYYAGIKHDYSMGYPDVAGFRLGTARPVKFINPNTRLVSELILHPLALIDTTLSGIEEMNLDEEEATQYALDLVRTIAQYQGELNLLWHNENLSQQNHPWLGRLYRSILHLIAEIETNKEQEEEQVQTPELKQILQEYGGTEILL